MRQPSGVPCILCIMLQTVVTTKHGEGVLTAFYQPRMGGTQGLTQNKTLDHKGMSLNIQVLELAIAAKRKVSLNGESGGKEEESLCLVHCGLADIWCWGCE